MGMPMTKASAYLCSESHSDTLSSTHSCHLTCPFAILLLSKSQVFLFLGLLSCWSSVFSSSSLKKDERKVKF